MEALVQESSFYAIEVYATINWKTLEIKKQKWIVNFFKESLKSMTFNGDSTAINNNSIHKLFWIDQKQYILF